MKRIVIAGGTGSLGSSLAETLSGLAYNVIVLTRGTERQVNPQLKYVSWDGSTLGRWTKYLDGAFLLMNFCGMSVDCRYTSANKKKLITSRVNPTLLLGEAINQCEEPPRLWINASSSAYYGFSEEALDESAGSGADFPASICMQWEDAFFSVQTPRTRKVALRLGIVLQRGKGFILPFENLVKTFVGGKLGSGQQYFTWIHEDDFLHAIHWLIENTNIDGPVNITSPEPVTNEKFMLLLRNALHYSWGFSLPSWLLTIGGKITGTEPYLILKGRRIIPTKLLKNGFRFHFPTLEAALQNLYQSR